MPGPSRESSASASRACALLYVWRVLTMLMSAQKVQPVDRGSVPTLFSKMVGTISWSPSDLIAQGERGEDNPPGVVFLVGSAFLFLNPAMRNA